jgi:uncharacterized secreted protein with C-terminal beta-propeller domain
MSVKMIKITLKLLLIQFLFVFTSKAQKQITPETALESYMNRSGVNLPGRTS